MMPSPGAPRAFQFCQELSAQLDPRGDRLFGAARSRTDEDEALHRTAREVHRTRVRPAEGLAIALRPNTNHEIVLDDPAQHLAVDKERQAAEHLLLADASPAAERAADALGQLLVVRHPRLYCVPGGRLPVST